MELNRFIENAEESPQPSPHPYTDFENSTYLIVSKIAYLIGVPKRIFENEHEPPKLDIYEQMDQNKNARIIRNLCMIRTGLEKYFTKIQRAMIYDLKNIDSLPEYIPPECARQLYRDGIPLLKANYKPDRYIYDINRYINERINNCRTLLPIWLEWEYIRELFIMPGGTSETGAKRANKLFHDNIAQYPYQVYINWDAADQGNILYNDKKFVSLLYEYHENCFQEMSKVTDAGNLTKNGIYDFLAKSGQTVFVVDCENSDPYKLYAVLNNLNDDSLSKISKIILYNDVHTSAAWQILNRFTEIPVEHIMIERVKQDKSLVDMRLAVGTCKEFYQNHADSFVIVSSDSDYWALISAMPDARFLVMVEEEKCGVDIKNAMQDAGIFYCYIDDFCTGNSNEIKIHTLLSQIRQRLDAAFHLNIQDMLRTVYYETMIDMTEGEKRQFYNQYIKPMRIVIDPEGNASIRLGGD